MRRTRPALEEPAKTTQGATKTKAARHGTGTARGAPSKTGASEEEIRQRAFEIFKARGGAPGHEVDDWVQAERECRARTR